MGWRIWETKQAMRPTRCSDCVDDQAVTAVALLMLQMKAS